MKALIVTLVCYLAATSALASALAGGIVWLVRTDATESAPARVTATPPRIADSIERKKPVPPQVPETAQARSRPMQQANVALSQPTPKWVIRELRPPPMRSKARLKKSPPAGAPVNPVTPSYAATTTRDENPSGL
jgi:hypothetical protein